MICRDWSLPVPENAALTAENPYAFIYGNIIPFSRMEQDKVYEDDRYVIYDMTDLFYTDLDAYLDDFVGVMKGKVSLYFDEQIRRRVHNVYDYFRDAQTLSGLIENHQAEMERKAPGCCYFFRTSLTVRTFSFTVKRISYPAKDRP